MNAVHPASVFCGISTAFGFFCISVHSEGSSIPNVFCHCMSQGTSLGPSRAANVSNDNLPTHLLTYCVGQFTENELCALHIA